MTTMTTLIIRNVLAIALVMVIWVNANHWSIALGLTLLLTRAELEDAVEWHRGRR